MHIQLTAVSQMYVIGKENALPIDRISCAENGEHGQMRAIEKTENTIYIRYVLDYI